MNYPQLMQIESEIKVLLNYRLPNYQYDHIIVEAYYALDGSVMCRIELFGPRPIISDRIAKYEAELKKGFYYGAEQSLIGQMGPTTTRKAS